MAIYGAAIDLEGTAVDVEHVHHHGHLAAAQEFGLTIRLQDACTRLHHFIGGPDRKVCEDIWNLLDERTRSRTTIDEILARTQYHYDQLIHHTSITPRPGFTTFCMAARSAGLKLAIGSLTPTAQATLLLERSGLARVFPRQDIVLAEDVVNLKPAPDVFLKTAERMGIDPSEQMVFEDSPRGVQAALAAGSKIVIGMPVILRPEVIRALADAGTSRIFIHWHQVSVPQLIKELGGFYGKAR